MSKPTAWQRDFGKGRTDRRTLHMKDTSYESKNFQSRFTSKTQRSISLIPIQLEEAYKHISNDH